MKTNKLYKKQPVMNQKSDKEINQKKIHDSIKSVSSNSLNSDSIIRRSCLA